MATNSWIGAALAVRRRQTMTPAAIDPGDTFTLTFANGKVITVTAPAGAPTASDIVNLLMTAIQDAADPQISEIQFDPSTPGVLVATADPGLPFTVASTSVGGTFASVLNQAETGPNHWDNAANWSLGHVPISTEDVIAHAHLVPILYGLDQTGMVGSFNSLTLSGRIGLSPTNQKGGYREYRQTTLKCKSPIVRKLASADGSAEFVNLETTVACTVHCVGCSSPAIQGLRPFHYKNSVAASTIYLLSGNIGVATFPAETMTVTTFTVANTGGAQPAEYEIGPLVTLQNVDQDGGKGIIRCTITTGFIKTGGDTDFIGTGTVESLKNIAGNVNYGFDGRIGPASLPDGISPLVVGSDATMNFNSGAAAISIVGNTEVYGGSTVEDAGRRVSFTGSAGIRINGSQMKDVKLNVGQVLITFA